MLNQEETKVDIKGALKQFIVADEPEQTQEEAIKNFEVVEIKNKKNSQEDEDEDEIKTEEIEHLKRVKQELLETLKRIEILEKKLFEETQKENTKNTKKKFKVEEGGKGVSRTEEKENLSSMPQEESSKETSQEDDQIRD